eukprot:943947-Alexandrium_andersonii.AAC.1
MTNTSWRSSACFAAQADTMRPERGRRGHSHISSWLSWLALQLAWWCGEQLVWRALCGLYA